MKKYVKPENVLDKLWNKKTFVDFSKHLFDFIVFDAVVEKSQKNFDCVLERFENYSIYKSCLYYITNYCVFVTWTWNYYLLPGT